MIIVRIVKKNLTVVRWTNKLNGTQMRRIKRVFAGFNLTTMEKARRFDFADSKSARSDSKFLPQIRKLFQL